MGPLHSIALEYSNSIGPVAIAKSRLDDGTKLRLAVSKNTVNVLAENIAGEALADKSATV